MIADKRNLTVCNLFYFELNRGFLQQKMNARFEKILVLERNEHHRLSLCEFLQNLGYRVTESNDIKNAPEMASVQFPDLIFIDLSDKKSLEVIYKIRQKKELSAIPILASSADGSFGIELFSNIERFGNDFIGYLTKPLSFAEIADQINLILLKRKKAA